jgi:diketogulonate reductase-like aldo/keto reductase
MKIPGAPRVAHRVRRVFCATKVWTPLTGYAPGQMQRSLALWKLARADLMQVHNLVNRRAHQKTLRFRPRRTRTTWSKTWPR